MNKKRIDELIPVAIEILRNSSNSTLKGLVVNNKIKSIYKGYVSAFPPTVNQSGMIKTLAFYSRKSENEGDKEKSERYKILNLFLEILKRYKQIEFNDVESLFNLYLKKKDKKVGKLQEIYLKNLILEVSLATKFAMMTFDTDKEE